MDGLRESAAWLDLSARGKIRVTGEDRARLLHAMTTQDVQSLTPGQGCYAFFLNAQGRILGDVNIFCREDFFLLDTEPETRQKLAIFCPPSSTRVFNTPSFHSAAVFGRSGNPTPPPSRPSVK